MEKTLTLGKTFNTSNDWGCFVVERVRRLFWWQLSDAIYSLLAINAIEKIEQMQIQIL